MPRTTVSRASWILGISLLLAGLQGCSDATEVPALDALPLWSATPGVRIGAIDDPDLSFSYVTDLKSGPDGRIYSLHMREPSIRRWTKDGRPAGRLGRNGSGPGEFEQPITMAWRADSLWVLDVSGYRINFFDTAGVSLAQIAPRFDLSGPAQSAAVAYPPRPAGYLPDGSILSQTPAFSSDVAEGGLRELAFVRTARDGTLLDTLVTVPIGRETTLAVMNENGGGTYTGQPYADGVISLPTADYDGLLILERKAASTRDAAEFRLSRISLEGDTIFSRTYPYLPTPIEKTQVDSLVASMAESLHQFVGARTGTTLEQWTAWVDEAMYKPEYHPPVETMLPGRDSTIWLSRTPPEDGQREWLVLSADGDPLARVRFPSGFRLLEAGENQVWGVESDDLDVEYIVSYEIAKE